MHEKGVNFTYNTCPYGLFGKQALAHLPFAMAPYGVGASRKAVFRLPSSPY